MQEGLGRFSGTKEDLIALSQAIQISDLVSGQPFKGCVAFLGAGKGIGSGGVILFRRDCNTVGIHMRNIPHSVPQHGMLYGIGVIGDGSAFQVDRRLDGIDLGARENNIVIDHVVPGVSIFDMVGINRIGHDVWEGFLRVLVQTRLAQGRGILADGPDLQVG